MAAHILKLLLMYFGCGCQLILPCGVPQARSKHKKYLSHHWDESHMPQDVAILSDTLYILFPFYAAFLEFTFCSHPLHFKPQNTATPNEILQSHFQLSSIFLDSCLYGTILYNMSCVMVSPKNSSHILYYINVWVY